MNEPEIANLQNRVVESEAEIARLKEWIKDMGIIMEFCTYEATGEICDECNCFMKRIVKPVTKKP